MVISISNTVWLHPVDRFPRGNSHPLYAKQRDGRWVHTRATGEPEPGWVLIQASDTDRAWLWSQGFFHEEVSPLNKLADDQQLMATTILERQGKPVPTDAQTDIAALATGFAQADAGMWAAARAIAEGAEPEPMARPEPPKLKSGWDLVTSRPGAVFEPEPKRKRKAEEPDLKVVRPEPEPKPAPSPEAVEMPVFTEELIAQMFANLAAHGMTLQFLLPSCVPVSAASCVPVSAPVSGPSCVPVSGP